MAEEMFCDGRVITCTRWNYFQGKRTDTIDSTWKSNAVKLVVDSKHKKHLVDVRTDVRLMDHNEVSV
jgi:DNA/RNA-binding domain of Phe-tRNA-synthetase-like protein